MTTALVSGLLGRHGDADLVAVGPAGATSAGELRHRAGQVAAQLDPDDTGPVLVAGTDRVLVATAVLAAWGVRREVVLPPNLTDAMLARVAAAASCTARIDADLVARAESAPSTRPLDLAIPADRRIASLFTSGTTGDVAVHGKTAGQLLGEAEALTGLLGVRRHDVVLATVPPHHIYGMLYSLLVPLLGGAAFVATSSFQRPDVEDAVRHHSPRLLVTVPLHLRELVRLPPGSLGPIETVVSSTAPLDPELAAEVARRFSVDLVEVFGSTETGGVASRRTGGSSDWTPLPGVTVDRDSDGRLVVTSPYVDGSEPYVTGDAVELTGEQRFRHTGRVDSVVKVGGKRISTAAIEQSLLRLDGVRDAAVLALPSDDERGIRLVAAVVADAPWTPRSLRQELSQWWDLVVLPRDIRLVTAIPRGDGGKTQRKDLLAMFADSTPGAGEAGT